MPKKRGNCFPFECFWFDNLMFGICFVVDLSACVIMTVSIANHLSDCCYAKFSIAYIHTSNDIRPFHSHPIATVCSTLCVYCLYTSIYFDVFSECIVYAIERTFNVLWNWIGNCEWVKRFSIGDAIISKSLWIYGWEIRNAPQLSNEQKESKPNVTVNKICWAIVFITIR